MASSSILDFFIEFLLVGSALVPAPRLHRGPQTFVPQFSIVRAIPQLSLGGPNPSSNTSTPVIWSSTYQSQRSSSSSVIFRRAPASSLPFLQNYFELAWVSFKGKRRPHTPHSKCVVEEQASRAEATVVTSALLDKMFKFLRGPTGTLKHIPRAFRAAKPLASQLRLKDRKTGTTFRALQRRAEPRLYRVYFRVCGFSG